VVLSFNDLSGDRSYTTSADPTVGQLPCGAIWDPGSFEGQGSEHCFWARSKCPAHEREPNKCTPHEIDIRGPEHGGDLVDDHPDGIVSGNLVSVPELVAPAGVPQFLPVLFRCRLDRTL